MMDGYSCNQLVTCLYKKVKKYKFAAKNSDWMSEF